MSILSALKAKGAKGKNIEEAVKTLPLGGGGGGNAPLICAYDSDNSHIDKKVGEIKSALDAGQNVYYNNSPDGISYNILQQFSINIDEFNNTYTANIMFGSSEFTTESANTLEALLDEYPIYY